MLVPAPPQPMPESKTMQSTAARTTVDAVRFLVLSRRTPMNARPAMGNQANASDSDASLWRGMSVEAAKRPAATVNCAVAWPVESKLIETGLIEHVGAPA